MPPTLCELHEKLAAIDDERGRIVREIELLCKRDQKLPPTGKVKALTPAEKVALFLELFGARRSVYPRFWHNAKTGKKGYAPACDNEWRRGVCEKPRVKCAECRHQRFPALDSAAVERHLRGEHTIGVYAIREDNGCVFLAADFDGNGWRDETAAYCGAARRCGIEAWIERSRSGGGAHVWIFFAEPVPAFLARKLGGVLLSLASAAHPTLGTSAYDRMFPNQDTLPAGGFGNLIALPLARDPRAAGNCVFLDERMEPERDQWAVLLGAWAGRLLRERLDETLARIAPMSAAENGHEQSGELLVLESEERMLDLSRPKITRGMLPGTVTVRLDSRAHVPRLLPSPVLAALRRLATFPNPVYHEKLRLCFSTHDTPRFIFAGAWYADRLTLPRGTLDAALRILETAGADIVLQDARPDGTRVPWKFSGELRAEQKCAVDAMLAHEHGVLCAPPGAGKTVMGCALASRCKTATLVLVHRSVLLDQWRAEAMRFLELKRREIGVWRGATRRLTGRFDIVMLPSATRVEDYAALFSGYGLVLVDECHHVPATSFEALMKSCTARRIIGLTATPARKDRLERLLYLQCGPIRHVLRENNGLTNDTARIAHVRQTGFQMSQSPPPPLHEIWDALTNDTARNELIVSDIRACVAEGRRMLVLSDRKTHLEKLESLLSGGSGGTGDSPMSPDPNAAASPAPLFRLDGDVGKRVREKILAKIGESFAEKQPFVLLATASLIGEGFDLPQLDTLFLAMPLSFKGRLVQYAGRLHRAHEAKREVRIYDYLDNLPVARAMFRRRSGAYRDMAYRIVLDANDEGGAAETPGADAGQLGMGL